MRKNTRKENQAGHIRENDDEIGWDDRWQEGLEAKTQQEKVFRFKDIKE